MNWPPRGKNPEAPIGLFDSGVGGLSVAQEIRKLLPADDLEYFADTAFCPYGGRPLPEIRERASRIGRFLFDRSAKLVVVACNSASGAALEALRAELPIPIVGMEPALKPAAVRSRNRRVGVLATAATLEAERFDRLMLSHARDVTVLTQACPGLVELVEGGDVHTDAARAHVNELLQPLRECGVDTVVLGCTHYPFLRGLIEDYLGPEVAVIDSGEAVARQTERVLNDARLRCATGSGSIRVWTSGDPSRVAPVVQGLWGASIPVEQALI